MNTITQAELFGADSLDRIVRDTKTGIGREKDRPRGDNVLAVDPKSCEAICAEVDRLYADVNDALEHHTHIGASPLPWHWEEAGGGAIDVYDARGAIVFDNINGAYNGDGGADRDWENVELMVACVNKFAALISPAELTRLRKLQVYGDETHDEGGAE